MVAGLWRVALLAEGVDRNIDAANMALANTQSPSSRRAWIEISPASHLTQALSVALLAEGVDRNWAVMNMMYSDYVALLAEGVDRNRWRTAT